MKVKMTLSIGYVVGNREDILELDDGLTEEQLEEAWRDWAWQYIDGGPEIVPA